MRRLSSSIVACWLSFSMSASATMISVTGNFWVGPGLFDLDTLNLSFSGSYDDSVVPSTGFYSLVVALDSLVVSPNYGTFDTSNATFLVSYEDGLLASAPSRPYLLGFDIDGLGIDSYSSVATGTNDLAFTAAADGIIDDFVIARAGFLFGVDEHAGIPFGGSISAAAIAVPEPPTMLLLGAGFAGLLAGCRRRRTPPVGRQASG